MNEELFNAMAKDAADEMDRTKEILRIVKKLEPAGDADSLYPLTNCLAGVTSHGNQGLIEAVEAAILRIVEKVGRDK